MTYAKTNIIQTCYERAKTAGYKCFGVQSNTQCVTGANACDTYDKYGAATGCKNGRGASWKSDIYRIKGIL